MVIFVKMRPVALFLVCFFSRYSRLSVRPFLFPDGFVQVLGNDHESSGYRSHGDGARGGDPVRRGGHMKNPIRRRN